MLCGHSVPFLATWPSSGMTLAGTAFELPTWARRTDGSGFSSSPIPETELLWTPVTTPERPQQGGDPEKWPASLNQQVTEDLPSSPTYRGDPDLLPTHMRNDPSYRSPESAERRSRTGFTDLVSALSAEPDLVPTPRAGMPAALSSREDYHHNLEEWANDPVARGTRPEPLDETLLFPTPAVNDMGEGKTLEEWDAWNAGETMRHQMHGQPLSIVAQDLDRSGSPRESLRRGGGASAAASEPTSSTGSTAATAGTTCAESASAGDTCSSASPARTTTAGTAGDPSCSAPRGAATAGPAPSRGSTAAPTSTVPPATPGVSTPLLPTPDAYQGSRGGSQDPAKRRAGGHSVSLADVTEQGELLLPTPTGESHSAEALLPTPLDSDSHGYGNVGKVTPYLLDLNGQEPPPQTGGWPPREQREPLLSTPKASNNENVCSESYSNLSTDLKNEVDPQLRLLGEGTGPRSDGGSES